MGKESKRNYTRGVKRGYTEGTLSLFKRYDEFAKGLGANEFLKAAGWEEDQPNWWVHEKTLLDNPDAEDYKKFGMPTIIAVVYEALR